MYLRRLRVSGYRSSSLEPVEVVLPGRFSVVLGANSAGKTTFTEAAYLGHIRSFPRVGRPSAANLGAGARQIEIDYHFEKAGHTEGRLGTQIGAQTGRNAPGTAAATWTRSLRRDLGSVAAITETRSEYADAIRFIYLPASRNPLDELAKREVRVLIELLRAQQQAQSRGRDLSALRARAGGLLEGLATDPVLRALEEVVTDHLHSLSAGVEQTWPYIRGQVVDDAYLARVLQLVLGVTEGREHALPLDVTGLGYVNLLHIAVILAAIPNAQPKPRTPGAEGSGASEELEAEPGEKLNQADAERESEEDSLFSTDPFHATVVIEEPEAHLHPQLQHSLVRYLREQVESRPDLQIVLTSHAPDIVTSAAPEELVLLRRTPQGGRVCRTIGELPYRDRAATLQRVSLHFDAARSAALFSASVLLVEGITDAALVRAFGLAWAGQDGARRSFINALSIVPIGSKVGEWPVEFLATPDSELVSRLAVLRDSDLDPAESPVPPSWQARYDEATLLVEQSHPTLEPAITPGNEALIAKVLDRMGLQLPEVDQQSIGALFRGARASTASSPAIPAGAAARRKGEFSYELAAEIRTAVRRGHSVHVPPAISRVLDHLFPTAVTDRPTK